MKQSSVILMSLCLLTADGAEFHAAAGERQETGATLEAKVTQASRPAKVDKWGGRSAREFASGGQQWLSLTVDVKPSQKGATIPLEEIRITSAAGAAFPLLAIDCATKDEPGARFLFLGDAMDPQGSGVFLLGKLAGMYQKNKAMGVAWLDGNAVLTVTSAKDVMFVQDKRLTLFLLFETPAASGPFELQIGKSVRTPVQLTGTLK